MYNNTFNVHGCSPGNKSTNQLSDEYINRQARFQTLTDMSEMHISKKETNHPSLPTTIDSSSFPHVTINSGKEVKNMSFVGIISCDDGLLGFGDSKTTVHDAFGYSKEAQGMKAVKIQKGNGFLVTAYNRGDSPNPEYASLDEWIIKNIDGFSNYNDFLECVSDNYAQYRNGNPYQFFIGAKDREEYFVQEFTVSGRQVQHNARCYGKNTWLRNNINVYAPFLDRLISQYGNIEDKQGCHRLTTKEMKELILAYLPEQIQQIDNDSTIAYNPVGLPINFEALTDKDF